jgi:murein DD-endopeptidase MepM/ murein hydrolase activator NlpD
MSATRMEVFPLAGWTRQIRMAKPRDPVKLCPALSYVESSFSEPRVLKEGKDKGKTVHHGAIDIFVPMGTPVLAAIDGVMWGNEQVGDTRTEWSKFVRGGWHFYLAGADVLHYGAHLLDRPLVRPGERVRARQLIGFSGRMEPSSSCPHLHYAMYPFKGGVKGQPINPFPYLKAAQAAADPNWQAPRGLVAGVGIGGGLVVAGAAAGLWWLLRRRRRAA